MRIPLSLAASLALAACNGALEEDLSKTNKELDGFSDEAQETLAEHASQLQSLESRVYTDSMAVAAMGAKSSSNPLHHDRYTDAEAVLAMGGKSDDNPLNHDRYSDAEALAAMGARADDNPHNHSRYTDAESRDAMGPKAHNNPYHHDRYTNAEAVVAMGAKSNANPLHHDRYTDGDAVLAMGVKANSNPLHHDRYTDGEAVLAMGTKANSNPLHHDRYTNAEALAAMGTKGNTNPHHHDRYTDIEVVAAVDAAGFMRIPVEVLMFEDHFETGISGLWTHTGGTTATTTTTPNVSSPWTDYTGTGTSGMLLNEAEILSRDFDEPGPAHVSAYFLDVASDASARSVIYVWGATSYVALGVYAPGVSSTHYAFSDQFGSWQPTNVVRRSGWHRIDVIADGFTCKGYIDDHLVFETRRADMRTLSAISVAQDVAGELMSGGFIVDDVVVNNVQ